MDSDTLRWIKQVLTNDEMSTDEGMVAYFMAECGLSEAEAKEWVAKRDFYRMNMVMQDEDGDDIGVYDPAIRAVKPLE